MKLILFLLAVQTALLADCIAVRADVITAGDLADAVPLFRGFDATMTLGWAPMPGVKRILSLRELVSLSPTSEHSLTPNELNRDLCIERFVRPFSDSEVEAALRKGIGTASVDLQVLDFYRTPLPPGTLLFERGGLSHPPADLPDVAVIWRGKLLYDGQHSLNIWAKVKLSIESKILAASETIPGGVTIRADQIQEIRVRRFPFAPQPSQSIQVLGKVAHREIIKGQAFVPALLEEQKDVTKGESVRVRGIEGSAVVSFDAVAESSGNKGNTILIRNPVSGRKFRALIEGRGKVIARPGMGV